MKNPSINFYRAARGVTLHKGLSRTRGSFGWQFLISSLQLNADSHTETHAYFIIMTSHFHLHFVIHLTFANTMGIYTYNYIQTRITVVVVPGALF
jgi:hypothetical protein